MQFLAILKDSVREALDARIFWIIGIIAGILVLLGLTMSFEPLPKGKLVINHLINGLIPPPSRNGPPVGGLVHRSGGPGQLFNAFQGIFRQSNPKVVLLDAEPIQGENAPTSDWRLRLEIPPDIAKNQGALDSVSFLKDHFGKFVNTPVVSVKSVKLLFAGGATKPDLVELEFAPLTGFLRLWPHKWSMFFGGLTILDCSNRPMTSLDALGNQILLLESILVAGIGTWVALLLSVALTSFFIPAMLKKGTVETLLVRPISRWRLLTYKYCGGLLFIGFGTSLILGAVWITISFKSGVWSQSLLLMIPVIVFYYAFLHSISTLGSVVTRSAVFGLIAACLVWFSLFLLNVARESIRVMDQVAPIVAGIPNPQREGPLPPVSKIADSTVGTVIIGTHRWLPRPAEIDGFVRAKLQEDLLLGREVEKSPLTSEISDWKESAGITLGHTVLALLLACLVFSYRDP